MRRDRRGAGGTEGSLNPAAEARRVVVAIARTDFAAGRLTSAEALVKSF
jgi:hypothetical protein